MTRVRLTDITLRENAKAQENTLSFKEMIEISKILDRLHLDTITLAPIVNVKVDSLLVRTIASAVKIAAVVSKRKMYLKIRDAKRHHNIGDCVRLREKILYLAAGFDIPIWYA